MKKGFTFVELLVVMAVIALLSGLVFVGIAQLNKSSRDSQRTTALAQIASLLNDYKRTALRYPAISSISFDDGFAIDGDTKFELEGILRSAPNTTENQTKYGYDYVNGKFGLCAVLESGNIENVGEITLDCR